MAATARYPAGSFGAVGDGLPKLLERRLVFEVVRELEPARPVRRGVLSRTLQAHPTEPRARYRYRGRAGSKKTRWLTTRNLTLEFDLLKTMIGR